MARLRRRPGTSSTASRRRSTSWSRRPLPSPRHKWNADEPRSGFSRCRRCHRVVETWRVRKGSLGKCPGMPLVQKRLDCRYHEFAGIAGIDYCWSCGRSYSEEEKKRFATLREFAINEKLKVKNELGPQKPFFSEETTSTLPPLD